MRKFMMWMSVVADILDAVVPAKLDPALLKEPRVIQGIPRIQQARAKRKPIPSILGLNGTLARAPTS